MNCPRIALALSLFTIGAFAQDDSGDRDHPQARLQWFYNQRMYPAGQIPVGARVKAITDIDRIDRAARANRRLLTTSTVGGSLAATLDAATWTLIGPQPTVRDLGSNRVVAGRMPVSRIECKFAADSRGRV